MATISKINDRYRVQIRKKNIELTTRFKNREDAELWAEYKEGLIEGISNFDVPMKNMITLESAIELKINELKKLNLSSKEISDYKLLLNSFSVFLSRNLNEITYNDYFNHFNTLLNTKITRGGTQKKDGTGIIKLPSIATIVRKFAYLSTVYQLLISHGVELENHPYKVASFFKKNYEKNK